MSENISHIFSQTGPLSQSIFQYRPRDAQEVMAKAVAECILLKDKLIVEAGTGIGKTFAYLIPALLSNKQIIISTASKNLQEQLFYQDLPILQKTLKTKIKVALLKGRSNYLCQLKLQQQLQGAQSIESKVLDELLKINQWAAMSRDGDFGSLVGVSENSTAIQLVASTQDSCSGKHCEFYLSCFTRLARIKTQDAKIIVVNHHLYFADRTQNTSSFAEILPDADTVIFDEAHQLSDIALNYFGHACSTKEFNRLLVQIETIYDQQLTDTREILNVCLEVKAKLEDWQNHLILSGSKDWKALLGNKAIAKSSWELLESLQNLHQVLIDNTDRSEQLDFCAISLEELTDKLESFINCENNSFIYSLEHFHQHILFKVIPVNIQSDCKALFDNATSWIFTSATLQISQSFEYFSRQLALTKAKQLVLESPFNYKKQGLICVPRYLTDVGGEHNEQQQIIVVQELVDICIKAINAADGRTFVLFTSHNMLNNVAMLLSQKITQPILVQGQGGKQSLLNKFKQLGNAVLLGTSSFWEGVDVRGKLLSCVIIDKLPFPSMDEPIYKSRVNYIQQQGKDPFIELSLTKAVQSLQQGVGRLIRDEKDRGVLILCDNRIVNRNYGQAFINTLPPMQRTRDLDKALAFLRKL